MAEKTIRQRTEAAVYPTGIKNERQPELPFHDIPLQKSALPCSRYQ
ncbi:hypothetical protein [Chlorobium sp. KB01]|nr:hypothetical protein [Chlorobium sp. KB01]